MDGIAEKKEDALLFTENSPLKQVTGKIKPFLDYKLTGQEPVELGFLVAFLSLLFWMLVDLSVHLFIWGFFPT